MGNSSIFDKPHGVKISALEKCICGSLCIFFVMFLVFGPFFLFSDFGMISDYNPVVKSSF